MVSATPRSPARRPRSFPRPCARRRSRCPRRTRRSSPMAAGVIALLFQANALLTQDQVRALLQTGAQHARGPSPFYDQNGAGEIDALGALDALDEMSNPDAALPDAAMSVMTLSEDYV